MKKPTTRRNQPRQAGMVHRNDRRKTMTAARITDWQFWNSVACARIPLGLLLQPEKISGRTQMKETKASAYVYRMFELFFYNLRDPSVVERLQEDESKDLQEFLRAFDALPWRPLSPHPHISELADDNFSTLVSPAKRLDRHLWLRTGRGLVPVTYRLFRGWPLLELSLKAKEVANSERSTLSVQPHAGTSLTKPRWFIVIFGKR